MNNLAQIPQIKNLNEEESIELSDPLLVYRGRYKKFIESILKERPLNEKFDYTECHHVIPTCCGGKDTDEDNIRIYLTYREHFIAHKILSEENPENDKLFYAHYLMCIDGRHDTTPEEYDIAKRKFSLMQRGETHTFYGKHHSLESRKRIADAHIGKKCTEETKKKISESKTGKPLSESHKKNLSDACKGRFMSEESRDKISKKLKCRIFTEAAKKRMSESCKSRTYIKVCVICHEEFIGKSSKSKYCSDTCRRVSYETK